MQTDLNDPTRNMFGLKPCPRCGDDHCYPTQSVHPTHPNVVLCDGCGWHEPCEELKGEAAEMGDGSCLCSVCQCEIDRDYLHEMNGMCDECWEERKQAYEREEP
jgi:hypothetical protein